MIFQSSIKSFYRNTSILVTGGSGFLGKVLLEKLLRTCDVECIYVVLRSKRGLSSEERYHKLIENPVFDQIRKSHPERLQKIAPISGDIAKENIGISNSDLQMLKERVNVVFNSAATVQFDNDMVEAFNLNTLGSKRLWDLCLEMKNLRSIIHVSTAYSNPNRSDVGEQVYPPKVQMDFDAFQKCADVLPDDLVESIATHLQGEVHPNTYTITKLMAEQIAAQYHQKLPIAIVRPSVITSSLAEPFPGWIDNVYGANGVFTAVGRGTLKSFLFGGDLISDLIPVDIVCNMVITAAWHNSLKPIPCVRVYNCTSGQLNRIDWKTSFQYVLKYSRIYPSKYTMLYPNGKAHLNRYVHFFHDTFSHLLTAYLYDVVLRCKGMKPIMFENAKRLKIAFKRFDFFGPREYNFEVKNVRELLAEVSKTSDGNEFMCDVRQLKWDEYFKDFVCGLRKHILKDDESSLEYARRKLKRLYMLKLMKETILFGTTGFIIYEIIF